MKQFIAHIEKSIFGPDYYEELLSRPAAFSWKYYWSFTTLLAVLMTIVTSLPLIPQVNRALDELPPAVLAYYPDAIEITVEGSGREFYFGTASRRDRHEVSCFSGAVPRILLALLGRAGGLGLRGLERRRADVSV